MCRSGMENRMSKSMKDKDDRQGGSREPAHHMEGMDQGQTDAEYHGLEWLRRGGYLSERTGLTHEEEVEFAKDALDEALLMPNVDQDLLHCLMWTAELARRFARSTKPAP